ncbi:MAG TPA: type II toxin-antitoxin system HicB family antitoxin [Caulobacteraceae bacterium]|jgi:antitoxin HicB
MRYVFLSEPDDNDTFLLTVPAIPETVTFAETMADAPRHLRDAIEEALAWRIAENMPIPLPDGDGLPNAVDLPPLTSLKVALYSIMRAEGTTRAELQRRLGWHREQVDRLFRLDHASRLDQIEAAAAALGLTIDIGLRAA